MPENSQNAYQNSKDELLPKKKKKENLNAKNIN